MNVAAHALVTGGSSGIGEAIVSQLLNDGWRVTSLDRNPVRACAAGLSAIAVDLQDPVATDRVLMELPTVTAFVHAAGVMRVGKLGALDHVAGAELWRLHVDAAIRIADHLAPRLVSGGRIVLIGSRAVRGVIAKSQYGAAKAALTALARGWAKELVGRGITVNVVAPAATDTGMLVDPERAAISPEIPPLGRLIRPDEVAALVGYLLSPAAAAITGQEIMICGGSSL